MGQIVSTEHHIQAGRHDRFAACRFEEVLRREHDVRALVACLVGQRHMDSHLVTVKVGVKGFAYERVQADSLALDKDWLECLDGEAGEG